MIAWRDCLVLFLRSSQDQTGSSSKQLGFTPHHWHRFEQQVALNASWGSFKTTRLYVPMIYSPPPHQDILGLDFRLFMVCRWDINSATWAFCLYLCAGITWLPETHECISIINQSSCTFYYQWYDKNIIYGAWDVPWTMLYWLTL